MKKKKENKNALVVHNLNIVSANRGRKDIGTFITALTGSESISYPNRSLLYDIYEDSLLDGHLFGLLSKRINLVLNKRIHFQDKEGRRVEEMDNVIGSNCFREIVEKIIETQFWGITGLEFVPGAKLAFEEIPRKHIKPELKLIVKDQNDIEGISYEGMNNVWIIGDKNDKGILLKCAPLVIYKRGVFGDWAQYIELFGQPVRVIKYDAHDVKTKMELRQVLDESGSSLALMIPKQTEFQIMDGKESNGDGELQGRFIKTCNSELSILVLGNTETTSSSGNSGLAQAEEHAKQQSEIIKSDLKYVAIKLNSPHFIKILKSYGLPVEGGKFVYEKEINIHDLRKRIDIDVSVSKMVPLDEDYMYDTYGIPRPKKSVKEPVKEELNDELLANESSLDRLLIFIKQQFKQLQK